jgi:methyl-accepting chemotaxis protein
MEKLSIKSAGLFLLFWVIWNFAWAVSAFTLMNNSPDQYSDVIIPAIVIWGIGAIVGTGLTFRLISPLEKQLKNREGLSDDQLQKASGKALNSNITASVLFGSIWLAATVAMYLVLNSTFGQLASMSIWVGGLAGLLAVPFMLYGAVSMLFSKANRAFSAELYARGKTSKGINFSIRNKLIFVFGASILAVSLWIGLFGYYTGVNQRIEEIKESRTVQLDILSQTLTTAQINNLSETDLIAKLENINLPDNEAIMTTDNSGQILSGLDKIKQFTGETNNTQKLVTANLSQQSVYDNINQNVLTFHPSGSNFHLVMITSVETGNMMDFWIWFTIFVVIGMVVAGTNSYTLSSWISNSTNNLRTLFDSLAQNDYSHNATKDSEDELGLIAEKYNHFIVQVRTLLNSLQDTSKSVLTAGEQLSALSQQLATGANRQAATSEEVSSAMQQMVSIIESNAENAEITGKTSKKSVSELFTQTMNSVSDISNKIEVISDIAIQTNILALNAAVEAARAGEAGRGFSVVAAEVRKLAEKSKVAAEEITKISKGGRDISKLAGEKLNSLIPEITKSADLVSEIVAASREQKTGAQEINASIQELAEMTNENSASAEELSASAEGLTDQAQQLEKMISRFNIGTVEVKEQ